MRLQERLRDQIKSQGIQEKTEEIKIVPDSGLISQSNQFGVSDKRMNLSQYAYGALSVVDQVELVLNSLLKEMRDAIINSSEIEDVPKE